MLSLLERTMLGAIPSDWEDGSLKSLLVDHMPGNWGADIGPEMFPVIRSTNLTNDGPLDLSNVAMRSLPRAKVERLTPLQGDILLERSGGGPDQPVGRVAYVNETLERHAFSNFLHLLRPNSAKVEPRFLYRVLYRVNRTGRILRLEQQTTQMRNLNFRDYLTIPVPLPPPDEQKAIADVLDSVDTAIERSRAAIGCARQLRRHTLHQVLHHGLTPCAVERTRFGLKPKHWSREHLGNLIEEGPTNGVYLPATCYGDEGTPIIRIDSFDDGAIHGLDNLQRVRIDDCLRTRYEVARNALIINRVNSLSHIGKAAIVPQIDEPTIFESNMMVLTVDKRVDPKYLILVLCSSIAQRHWLSRAKPAVNQASINQRDVRELPLPLPPPSEQQDIVKVADALSGRIKEEQGKLDALQTVKSALMQDLLTGRRRLAQARKVGVRQQVAELLEAGS